MLWVLTNVYSSGTIITIQHVEHFHHLVKISPVPPLYSVPFPHPMPLATTHLVSVVRFCFHSWLLSCSLMLRRLICAVVCIRGMSLLYCCVVVPCMDAPQIIRSPVDGHSGCFQVLVILNEGEGFVWTHAFIFLESIPRTYIVWSFWYVYDCFLE